MKARGVSLRYRENYFATRDTDEARDRPTLEELLKEPLNATQIELRLQTTRDPSRPGVLIVSTNVDLHDIDLGHDKGRHRGAVDVSFYVEGGGKVLTKTLKIDIPDDQFAAFFEKGIDTVESVDTSGGREALRVVAQDRTTGAAGSVTIPLR